MSAWQPIPTDDETVRYVSRYGGFCRDCADEFGVCPASGLPCADDDKAIRHVITALNYGYSHGYLPTPAETAASDPTGSGAYTAEGKETRDALLNPPTPSACSELVEKLNAFDSFLNEPGSHYRAEPPEVREYRHAAYRRWEKLVPLLQASQARATAAEQENLLLRQDTISVLQGRLQAAEAEMPSREEIARVLAPKKWAWRDEAFRMPSPPATAEMLAATDDACKPSLAKADAILALRKPSSATKGPADVAE